MKRMKAREFVEHLKAEGWELTALPWSGHAILSHPLSNVEHQTGEDFQYVYPFSTYRKLFQITFNYNPDGAITALWVRGCPAPWVRASERPVSFKRAMEYAASLASPAAA